MITDAMAAIQGMFVTLDQTGAKAAATITDEKLYVNGVSSGRTVTVTGTNPYKWSVTLPALPYNNNTHLQIGVTATIAGVSTTAVVFSDVYIRSIDLQTLVRTDGAIFAALEDQFLAVSGWPDSVLDTVIDVYTARQILRLLASGFLGKASGGNSTPVIYRDLGDTKDRIRLVVDASGNRSAVTLDGA